MVPGGGGVAIETHGALCSVQLATVSFFFFFFRVKRREINVHELCGHWGLGTGRGLAHVRKAAGQQQHCEDRMNFG